MLKSFRGIARRQFFTLLGSSAFLGIATKSFFASSASAQTIAQRAGGYAIAQTTAPTTPVAGDAIDILIADHRKIEALMDQIAQTPASNPTGRAQLLQQLAQLFTVHNASEENYIYPAIRDLAKLPADATTLYHQQDEAKVLVFELDQLSKSSPDWEKRFATLRSAVLAHVEMEEKTDFPKLRQAAGSKMAALTTKVQQLRSAWNFT